MDDGGLQLNFAVGDLPAPSKAPKFKGGSWKERSRLNKSAKNGRSDATTIESRPHYRRDQAFERATQNKKRPSDESPAKRRRLNPSVQDQQHNEEREKRRRDERPIHLKDAVFTNQPGNRQVISSLFSYNPEAKTEQQEEVEEEPKESAKPTNAPLPDGIDTFTSLGLTETVAAHLITKMDFKNPTAIQKAAVSQLTKEDADVFIQSQTGSGKTLAYLLPIVQRLVTVAERSIYESQETGKQGISRDSGLFAIILAPTRELCKQISMALEKLLGCAHFIVAGSVSGGERKKSEKARLRKGLNILVATPGRLVDHLDNTSVLDISKVRYLVLDEGDRLMELGFDQDIRKVLTALDEKQKPINIPGLPSRRITMLCSATLQSNVEKLGEASLKDAVLVRGETDDDSNADSNRDGNNFLAPAQLKQSYVVCAAKLRLVALTALLKRTFARKGSVMKAIVFFSCADSVDFHHKILTRTTEEDSTTTTPADTDSTSPLADALAPAPLLSTDTNPLNIYKIHGSLPQQTRTAIIKSFAKSTTASLLLATDVASRGLDLPNLDLVIEYDPAFSKDDHLHRIGRTARVGRDGRAVIFLLPGSEEGYVQVLRDSYKQNADTNIGSNVVGTSAEDVLKKGFVSQSGLIGSKASGDDYETLATEFQLVVERYVLADTKVKELAKNAFQSHVRAYATHVAAERKWFDIKELHLGHLAKAFGLRDPPGKVNVAGVRNRGVGSGKEKDDSGRPKANEGRKRVGDGADGAKGARSTAGAAEIDETGDAEAAAEKMRALIRNRKKMMGAGADEFNIG